MSVKVGDAVVYVDPYGTPRAAVVTAVWGGEYGSTAPPGLNVVFVSGDEKRDDSYGRQVERATSVCHRTVQPAHGNFWQHVGE